MKLIDAMRLKNKAFFIHTGEGVMAVVLYKDIVNAPTIDAVSIVHGRWIDNGARMDGDTDG